MTDGASGVTRVLAKVPGLNWSAATGQDPNFLEPLLPATADDASQYSCRLSDAGMHEASESNHLDLVINTSNSEPFKGIPVPAPDSHKTVEELVTEFVTYDSNQSEDNTRSIVNEIRNALEQNPEEFISLAINKSHLYQRTYTSTYLEALKDAGRVGSGSGLSQLPFKTIKGNSGNEEYWGQVEAISHSRLNQFTNKFAATLSRFRRPRLSPARSPQFQPKGIGIKTFNNQVKLVGTFNAQGCLEGKGVAYTEKGTFSGTFKAGCPHGPGTFYFENGDYFEGNYEHGHASGDASFTSSDGYKTTGKVFLGCFKENIKTENLGSENNQKKSAGSQSTKEITTDSPFDGSSAWILPSDAQTFLRQHEIGVSRDSKVCIRPRPDGGWSLWKDSFHINNYQVRYQISHDYKLRKPAATPKAAFEFSGTNVSIHTGGSVSTGKK